jgi:deoxyribodipyrimidine photo-lyase
MGTVVMLFTRDLRVHDNPALAAAVEAAERVVPAFVLDDAILKGPFGAPNRTSFLLGCLEDLRGSLRRLGGDLVVRRGDWVAEAVRIARDSGARAIFLADDVSGYAADRRARLAAECERHRLELRTFPGVTVVPPAGLLPAGGDHYRVFTPYWRAWRSARRREVAATPAKLVPTGVAPGKLPAAREIVRGPTSGELPAPGESAGRSRAERWLRDRLGGYQADHDDLAGDRTSRLSPYLHFGCLSALSLALEAGDRDAGGAGGAGETGEPGEAFLRQLCWRDFHHQVTAAFPAIARRDYRSRGDHWDRDPGALDAWRDGRTGYPIVDAGMRQLRREGWMHNRARLIVASFLVRYLNVDWRAGAEHFFDWLVDGDLANNAGNWQWVAGTGNDTRPNRVLSPLRQADRFDPDGDYVRRHLPELDGVPGGAVQRPWRLDPATRRRLDYPDPILDPEQPPKLRRRRGAKRAGRG